MAMAKRMRRPRAGDRRVRRKMDYKPRPRPTAFSARTPHTFIRNSVPIGIPGNIVNNPYVGNTSLALGAVNNSTEFSNLYDQYRIIKIVTKIFLKVEPGAQSAATAVVPRLFYYRDFDDSNSPSNLAEMRENSRCTIKALDPYNPVVIHWRPNTIAQIFGGGYNPVWNQWLDASNLGVTHYGHKIAIDNLTNTNYSVEIENQITFQCRNAR